MNSSDKPSGGASSASSGGKKGKYKDESHAAWRDLVPHCIYFYYFTPKASGGGYDNEFYFFDNGDNNPISEATLRRKIDELVRNAAGPRNPRPEPTKFGQKPWRRVSWLVAAVKGKVLEPGKAAEIKYTDPSPDDENHSFFDGKETSVRLPGGEEVSVMWAWNHMRDAAGNLLDHGQSDNFNFKLRLLREALIEEIDENGTNTGPTVKPPPRDGFLPPHARGHGHGKAGAEADAEGGPE